MSEPLSWQPKPVTSCRNCPHLYVCDYNGYGCKIAPVLPFKTQWEICRENFEAITPSCPAWQAQQKEKTE